LKTAKSVAVITRAEARFYETGMAEAGEPASSPEHDYTQRFRPYGHLPQLFDDLLCRLQLPRDARPPLLHRRSRSRRTTIRAGLCSHPCWLRSRGYFRSPYNWENSMPIRRTNGFAFVLKGARNPSLSASPFTCNELQTLAMSGKSLRRDPKKPDCHEILMLLPGQSLLGASEAVPFGIHDRLARRGEQRVLLWSHSSRRPKTLEMSVAHNPVSERPLHRPIPTSGDIPRAT
jgi:hypothetical protein